jgi:O-acetyl-ADP-ribose deacetylase (regulator of RNase III)
MWMLRPALGCRPFLHGLSNMKYIKFGNLLYNESGIIAQGCNSRGVFGSGLALQVKEKWPECFTTYVAGLKALKDQALGKVIYYQTSGPLIANAITQENFGRDPTRRYVDYNAVQACFRQIASTAFELKLPVHYPQIGAGLGNGDWTILNDIIDIELRGIESYLWLYES